MSTYNIPVTGGKSPYWTPIAFMLTYYKEPMGAVQIHSLEYFKGYFKPIEYRDGDANAISIMQEWALNRNKR